MFYKNFPAELKASTDDDFTFSGYASTFGNRDLMGDIVQRGAFKKTLSERYKAGKVKVLYQHRDPIGRPTELREDKRGLFFTAKVSETSLGHDVMTLIRDGVIDSMSIGYDVISYKMVMNDDEETRILTELKLYEFSPVTFPANESADITAAKALLGDPRLAHLVPSVSTFFEDTSHDAIVKALHRLTLDGDRIDRDDQSGLIIPVEFEDEVKALLARLETKAVVPFQDLPLASQRREWDSGAALRRVREFTDDEPTAAYKSAFLWYDRENADTFGAYKLPIADVVSGELRAVPRGIFAAAAALQGARGGVDVPSGDVSKLQGHLEKYYAKMRREFDDDSITAPWKSSGNEYSGTVDVLGDASRKLDALIASRAAL